MDPFFSPWFSKLSVFFFERNRKKAWAGRFITLTATLKFRELWLCNTLSSALKHLNNPYPHVHKNQIIETSFHSWRLLQTKQRVRVAVYLICFEIGVDTGTEWVDEWIWVRWLDDLVAWGGVVRWKHYCISASDPVSSKLSSVHCGNSSQGEYGLERRSGCYFWLSSGETYQKNSGWPALLWSSQR